MSERSKNPQEFLTQLHLIQQSLSVTLGLVGQLMERAGEAHCEHCGSADLTSVDQMGGPSVTLCRSCGKEN